MNLIRSEPVTVCAPSLREGRLAAKNRVALCSLLMAVTRPNLGAKNELLATVDCYMTRSNGQPRAARRDCQLRVHRYGETIGLIWRLRATLFISDAY